MSHPILKNNFYFEPLEQFEVIKLFYYNFLNKILFFFDFFFSFFWNKLSEIKHNGFQESLSSFFYNNEQKLLPNYYFKAISNDNISYYLLDSFDSNVDVYTIYLVEFFSINNSFIYFFLIIFSILFLIVPVTNKLHLLSNNWQITIENLYNFVADMLLSQVGKVAQKFLPYIFSIFMFILISNVLGMALFSFTVTSHIMVTFTLGVSSFIGLTILGFFIQKLSFLELFIPKGIPKALLPMLVIIEIISYLSRALSLSIRLFANLMSGHTLLHILAFFSSKLFKYKFIIGLISFLLILAIVSLEFCIALLQAYVFAILICIYLNDSFNASH